MLFAVAHPLLVSLVVVSTGGGIAFGDLDVIAAMDALAGGNDELALAHLESFLAAPHDRESVAEARLLASRAALNLGYADRALALLADTREALPEVADLSLAYAARARRESGDWPAALSLWLQILHERPDSPFASEARYGCGDALFAASRWREAKAAYEGAIKAVPSAEREPMARFNLAYIAEQQRRYFDAAAGYRYLAFYRGGDMAGELAQSRFAALVAEGHAEPHSFWQLLSLADLLLTARSLDEAALVLKSAEPLVRGGGMQSAFDERRAKLAYRQRNFELAATLFSALAEASRGRDRIGHEQWLARTYSTAGRFDDAIATYLAIARREGKRRESREALFKAAWLGYNGGNYQKALKLFGEFLARYPNDSAADEAHWYMAWNAYRLGDLPTAQSLLVHLRERFPRSALVQRTHYWDGRFAIAMGNATAGREAFLRAVALDPLSYYGVLAAQRKQQLDADLRPLAFLGGGVELASLESAGLPATPEPAADELPAMLPMAPLEAKALPWGASVFDWDSASGRRALRLIKLGLSGFAADLVARLPAIPGQQSQDVAYARARLLYSLGDYNVAYRIVDSAFGGEMNGRPTGALRGPYHLAYPDAYNDEVSAAGREFKISPLFILSIMRQESAFDDRARSWASAHGLMQIIPATGNRIAAALGAAGFSPATLRAPAVSIRFGGWYLAQLLAKYRGNVVLAAASYNAGPENVSAWVNANSGRPVDEFVEEIPYRETRHYVKRILGNLAVYSSLYSASAFKVPDAVPTTYLDNINF